MTHQARLADEFGWDQVQPITMPEFLSRFTLHDSWFRELTVLNSGSVLLTIGFDLVWNAAVPEGFETLMILFDRPYSQRWVQGTGSLLTLTGADSTPLKEAEREKLLNDEDFDLGAYNRGSLGEVPHPSEDESVTRTRFHFMTSEQIQILHGSSVRCVVVGPERKWIDIATIAAEPRFQHDA